MEHLSWSSIGFYMTFSIFVFYQQLHSNEFKGASLVMESVLVLFAFAGWLTGIIYLIYYGWVVVWWAPVVIFLLSLLSSIPGIILERVVGKFVLSMAGFLVWPVCAYFMFTLVPNAT